MRTAQELSEQIASMEQQLQAAKRQRTVPSAAATADLSYGIASALITSSTLTARTGSSSYTQALSSSTERCGTSPR